MRQQRILIVEDDANLLALMQERLETEGFAVSVAADGETALRELPEQHDLILLDIMLPKMGGLDLMKSVREQGPWGAKVPIIVISNLNPDTNEILNASAAYTPVFYLVKAEFSLQEIVERVKAVLSPS